MNLIEFSTWYKSLNFPKGRNPWSGKVYYTDCSTSTIIFAHENFLVEEYHLFPNAVVPLHSHPFETVSIFLGGSFLGYKRDERSKKTYGDDDIFVIGNVLPVGQEHGFTVGADGATLLVISQWNNLDQRDSATMIYTGPTMGPMHDKLLEKVKSTSNE
jgi:quercetin dioxygenase-like cupin family protein